MYTCVDKRKWNKSFQTPLYTAFLLYETFAIMDLKFNLKRNESTGTAQCSTAPDKNTGLNQNVNECVKDVYSGRWSIGSNQDARI